MTEPVRLILASGNPGKAREFDRLLGAALSVDPLPLGIEMPEETGATFAENARLKARSVGDAMCREVAVLADDSGLEVNALEGKPGVMSARFAGIDASDRDNVAKLLGEMRGATDRRARFVCCLCLALPSDLVQLCGLELIEVEGVSLGVIVSSPRGGDGFGYDPVFQPVGWTQTLAETAPEDKDHVSHRGAACRLLLQRLRHLGIA